MAERTDLTTFWEESPRLIEIASPSVGIVVQDLHDTLKSNTEQASEADDSLDNLDDDPLIDSAGKENLGGGNEVAITATLDNAQVLFESRLTPTETGTVTTANGAGTTLIDSAATFVTNGVTRGAVVINFTDQSITEVLKVDSETQLTTRVLRAGTENDYDSADVYKVWNIIQCEISGGNLTAVDLADLSISPVFPTAFTQIVRTASSSATATNQPALVLVEKILRNKMITDPVAGTITVFDDDGTTVLLTANLSEDAAATQPYRGQGAERRERLV